MIKFKYFVLKEEPVRAHHITFGRGNPFHEMHAQLGQHVKDSADAEGAGHSVILSGSSGDIKNPLTPEQKLKHAKRAMPGVNVIVADKSAPTLLHHAANLHQQGINDLAVHVGSDRVDEFSNLLNKYNGDNPNSLYNFKRIRVLPFGNERTEDGSGKSSYSASKMRSLAALASENTPAGISARKQFHAMAPAAMNTKQKDEMLLNTQQGLAAAAAKPARKKKVVAESCCATTTAAGLGGGIGSAKSYLDTNALDQEDVNANFMDYVAKNHGSMHAKIGFNNSFGKSNGKISGPAAARAFQKKRKTEKQ